MCSLHPNWGLTGPGPPQVKCDQYWPTRGTETYGLIQVTLLDTVELATYSVRTFALYKVGRTRTQCLYNACCAFFIKYQD